VKRLKTDVRGKGADAERANFIKELRILVTLRHPRICQFLGASTDPNRLFIVIEFMSGGSLHDFIYGQEEEEDQNNAFAGFGGQNPTLNAPLLHQQQQQPRRNGHRRQRSMPQQVAYERKLRIMLDVVRR
jgi:serine/threonine protein kinase